MYEGSSVAMHCGIGHRCSSDPALQWLWHRPAATAPIGPLAWEPPYVAGEALKRQKKKKKEILHLTNRFTYKAPQNCMGCIAFRIGFDLYETL